MIPGRYVEGEELVGVVCLIPKMVILFVKCVVANEQLL